MEDYVDRHARLGLQVLISEIWYYGVEYEPAYVDLCVRRWQTYTGRDAVLLGNGRCFSELLGQKRGPRAAPSFLKETVR